MKDPYQGLTLHHERFDWSDSSLGADSITTRIIGEWDYWADADFEGMEPWEIERAILFEGGRRSWGSVSPYGKAYYQHFLTLMKLMFPDTDVTPSLADAVMFFCIGISNNKKILNLIGSQNAGKSAAAIRIAFVCMYIDPLYTSVFVANPFDNAADSTVWGDAEELWDQLVEAHPNTTGQGHENASALFPYGRKYANKSLEFVPDIPKAAKIELRNTKHVGKYKGSKTRGKQVWRGILLVIVDEVNEIENMSFLTTLTNIMSQDAFFSITSQNFKDEQDMGGRLAEPVGTYGGPISYDDLDVETSMYWHSKSSSVTLRLDGLKSPNILAGRTIYEKLFKQNNLDRIVEDYGDQSPEYFSQVRSFPIRGVETNSVLSTSKISASRHKDPHYTLIRSITSVGFSDPSFGGRDKAVYGHCKFGQATVLDAEGNPVETELMVFDSPFDTLKLVKDAVYNDYWIERLKKAKVSLKDITLGSLVSYEDQIAIQCHELNQKYGVPSNNFGYDFSMRPDIVSSMNKIIGYSCVAFDYNQGPLGIHLHNINKSAEDTCKNRLTELAFSAADSFLTKQVRGGQHIETAIIQLSRTLYETKNGKYLAEDKKAYKARWQQVSPDHRDTLMGLNGMAAMRGFRQIAQSATVASGSSVFEEILASGFGKSRVGKRIY
jgi:hypothetical protein